ncbi:MAG: cold-shock protein [Firmicutes bacterium]|nr:cold-shock protein [Bacillota bacterium]
MAQGKVKWFNNGKGFGFIEQDEGKDLFVHFKSIQDSGFKSLNEGDIVEYSIGTGPKGDMAIDVKVIARGPASREKRPQERKYAHAYSKPRINDKPFNNSLEDQLKALRKSSKENQQDLVNRLKRR